MVLDITAHGRSGHAARNEGVNAIYKAMDDGRVDLLAIGNHKLSPTATDYIDILNTWYGYPDIPLAQSPTPVLNDHAPDYTAAV